MQCGLLVMTRFCFYGVGAGDDDIFCGAPSPLACVCDVDIVEVDVVGSPGCCRSAVFVALAFLIPGNFLIWLMFLLKVFPFAETVTSCPSTSFT